MHGLGKVERQCQGGFRYSMGIRSRGVDDSDALLAGCGNFDAVSTDAVDTDDEDAVQRPSARHLPARRAQDRDRAFHIAGQAFRLERSGHARLMTRSPEEIRTRFVHGLEDEAECIHDVIQGIRALASSRVR